MKYHGLFLTERKLVIFYILILLLPFSHMKEKGRAQAEIEI